MSYLKKLQLYKEKLTLQLRQKAYLKERYAVHGYVSRKTIDGRKYNYLQFHNADGELVSLFLNDANATIYDTAVKEVQKLEKKIEYIKQELKLFDGVPLTKEVSPELLNGNIYGFRLLNNAVGISDEFHTLFTLIPGDNLSEYKIKATYRKKEYCVPMIFVNERYLSNIGNYVKEAGIIIDETIRKDIKKIPSIRVLKGTTVYGVKYTARRIKGTYTIMFKYNGENIKLKYEPVLEESYMSKYIHKTKISEIIDSYCNNRMSEDALRRLYG